MSREKNYSDVAHTHINRLTNFQSSLRANNFLFLIVNATVYLNAMAQVSARK